ncbi:hypothetical protein [Roseateles sp.]|jgi:hypothetical protein|uniref:hypothetical protein n=1 Tax=Roseateles sp. TaxID=1971397 RepID=UPI00391C3187
MSRLTAEFSRLYLHDVDSLLSPQGCSRALVLALHAPADWSRLGQVWNDVQQDLDLPAPAIAVSGRDAIQLWFSLAQAVDLDQAQRFLQGLQRRYLADLSAQRLELLPQAEAAGPHHAARVPAEQVGGEGHWSAFVAADLAPVFADTPWLDMPPSDDGQADLLKPLVSIKPEAFAAALAQLAPAAASDTPASAAASAPAATSAGAASTGRIEDPRQFLLQVMNDASAPLAQRIEAAKILVNAPAAR